MSEKAKLNLKPFPRKVLSIHLDYNEWASLVRQQTLSCLKERRSTSDPAS
jgi:hypothetical protein